MQLPKHLSITNFWIIFFKEGILIIIWLQKLWCLQVLVWDLGMSSSSLMLFILFFKKKKIFPTFFFASLYLLHCSYFFLLQILLIQIIWSILQRNSFGWRKLKFFNLLLKVRHLSTILKIQPNTFYYYSGTRSGVYQ